jgi:transposase
MAPKKKEYSVDLRQTVIKHFLNGDSEHEIAQKVIIPRTSVHYIIDKYKKTKCIRNIIGRGRKRKTTIQLDRVIQRKVKVNRRKSASSVKAEIETELGMIISEQTVRRRLHEAGFKGRVARKKPYVDKANRTKRIQYAKTYREKPLGFWDQVLWTDESKFNLFGSDGKVMVWRTRSEALDPKCTVPTVKHGGGNVKCWGCMSSSGLGNFVFIDGNMTGEVYRSILQENLFDSVKKLNLGGKWIMQHDNDPKHRAHIVTKWLDEKGVERLKWPSFSPDLNPIEHIWDEVERRMKTEKPKNETELKQALLRVWHNIGHDITKKLVDSVPNRLNEVIKMNGYPTRY